MYRVDHSLHPFRFFVRGKGIVDLAGAQNGVFLSWTTSTNSARASALFSLKRLDNGASLPMGDGGADGGGKARKADLRSQGKAIRPG